MQIQIMYRPSEIIPEDKLKIYFQAPKMSPIIVKVTVQ
jgi:hypothetical protein